MDVRIGESSIFKIYSYISLLFILAILTFFSANLNFTQSWLNSRITFIKHAEWLYKFDMPIDKPAKISEPWK